MCDGKQECQDGSDETEGECKETLCDPRAFRCNYGSCIDKDKVCNGVRDCVDNSDELNCFQSASNSDSNSVVALGIKQCSEIEFQCKNGQCIDSLLICDGVVNCSDHSDESESNCHDF